MGSDELNRFRDAQKTDYETALSEIRAGRKRSHWMWYIFPQIHDLGYSSISQYYSIGSLQEAKDYLKNPVLGGHLNEISEALLSLKTDDPYEVFGSPDYLKLLSCMTLFEQADPGNKVFSKVIDKFYGGRRDQKTLEILKNEAPTELADREIYDTPIGPICMSKAEHEAYLEEKEMKSGKEPDHE